MRVLVLGGTLFIGRAVVSEALSRGWEVTTFNRGRSGIDVEGVDAVRGDRTNAEDLRRLAAAGRWDVVVDTSGYVPREVSTVAQALRRGCAIYVFVSTVSVYEGWPVDPLTERSQVLECPADAGPDFGPPDVEDGPTRYGRLKAGCEAAVRAEFGDDKTMVVRPGVVLGPGEYVGRLPWWLRRVHAGGTVLAPGSPTREIQPIDVRDVADFILDAAAASAMGTFNLTAPVGRSTFDDLMQACRTYTVSRAEFVWIADELLVAEGVRQWSEVPLWRTQPGVWRVDSSAAMVAGLRCRPLAETVRDTWLWMSEGGASLVNDRSIEIGLSADREATLLASLA